MCATIIGTDEKTSGSTRKQHQRTQKDSTIVLVLTPHQGGQRGGGRHQTAP